MQKSEVSQVAVRLINVDPVALRKALEEDERKHPDEKKVNLLDALGLKGRRREIVKDEFNKMFRASAWLNRTDVKKIE